MKVGVLPPIKSNTRKSMDGNFKEILEWIQTVSILDRDFFLLMNIILKQL